MDEFAVKVENVSKIFRLPHEKNSSIKTAVVNFYKRKKGYELQKALNDVSFEVSKGEFFGIVGRNGSGKSTLLKLLAGIYTPTSGQVHVRGSLTPFIELGVGFNPELTGRENVFLNGALLGFSRKQMQAMYKDIVDFAEIEKFMDQKLKNYSSGMQVRLAFSIAIRAQSDILVLDEVLAVGDEAFQQKCIEIFERYKAEKKTVILVTHDMETVRRFCTKAMLLDQGTMLEIGEPNMVASKYSQLNIPKGSSAEVEKSKIKLKLINELDKKSHRFDMKSELRVQLEWDKTIKNVQNVGIAIIKNSGEYIFGANTLDSSIELKNNKINYHVKLDLGPGNYYLMAGLFGRTKYDVIDFLNHGPHFYVNDNPSDQEHGMVRLNSKWETADD